MYVFVCYGPGMEAAVAEREVEMTEWNDGRLDELSKRVDDGFAEVREEFRHVNHRFERIDLRFEALQQLLVRMAWTYGIGMLAFAGALLGLIAAKF
jgi:tetrahydromethanopterin S-methyltransferase subunit G